MPKTFGNWPAETVIDTELINPVITGCEMKLTINPRRHNPSPIKIIPTKKLSVSTIFGSEVRSSSTFDTTLN